MVTSKRLFALSIAGVLLGFAAEPAVAEEPLHRFALTASLPSKVLGNDCLYQTPSIDRARWVICFPDKLIEKPTVDVKLASVDPMDQTDIRSQIRGSFVAERVLRVVSERGFALEHTPNAIGFSGVYETSLSLYRIWSVYDDGVLITATVSTFSEEADDDFEDAIMSEVFRPELFGEVSVETNLDGQSQ